MLKRKLSLLILGVVITNLLSTPLSVFAETVRTNNIVQESQENLESNSIEAKVSRFDEYYSNNRQAYDDAFKMNNSNIENITSTGGKRATGSVGTENIIDGSLDTYWETGKHTSDSFKNELIFTLKESTVLNRIAYRSAWNTVGFAENFEIWASNTTEGEDFQLVSSGKATKTADVVEIKFSPTSFKRIKFVFKNLGTATASEMMFYKEDEVLDKINSIFTDNTLSKVSEEFKEVDKINALEKEAELHPLYEEYKDYFANAKALLNQETIVETEAEVSKFDVYYTDERQAYDEAFKMDNSNIQNITSTGGRLNGYVGTENIIDGKLDTYWETGKHTSSSFENELIFTLNEETILNRIAYRSAWNTVGFAENFEVWASSTTKGDTFQLVTSATTSKTADVIEIKFNPTSFKRIKFVFKNNGTATASEMMFYKEDSVSDNMSKLFADDTYTKVSEEFNNEEALNKLEESIKDHPLYTKFKQYIDDAKAIVNNKEIEATTAKMKEVSYAENEEYNNLYKISKDKIQSITATGGRYWNQYIEYAIDGDMKTYWETGKGNDNNHTNEVEITFKETVKIDRVLYAPRQSDLKGFAKEIEIYGSQTSKGDTYQLVATGSYNKVKGVIEAKFNETEFKRLKFRFKNSDQNWASLSEIIFYSSDEVYNAVDNLFTDGTMSAVSDEYNTIDKINELESKAEKHPLYELFKDDIQEAKEIVSGQVQTVKTVVAEQQGDRVAHANNNLKIGLGNNNQPTGVVAMPGETITVYVDVEDGKPLPKLYFSQQEGSWANWGKTVELKPGKNEIVVPEVTQKDGWYHYNVTPGGPVYIVNPYTPEQQGKAPTIRFAKGVQTFPLFDKNTNEEEFIEFLKDYKARLDEDAKQNPNVKDRKMIDTFELVGDHVVLTFTATSAYEAYINGDFTPSKTMNMYNDHLDMLFKFQGLDGSSEKNDIKYTRENIRLAQPYGFMYAAGNHTGIQTAQQVGLLTSVGGWGIDHEIGHRMDIGVRELGEITNNMLPQKSANYYETNAENRIPYETHVYKNVIGIGNNEYLKGGYFENLAVFWQLEMVYPGYWAELNKLYREHDVKVSGNNDKLDKLAYYSSMALKVDLTEYFERHGFPVTTETKEYTKQFDKPENKIWYANETYLKYTGEGFSDDTSLEVLTAKHGDNIKVSFNVDENSKNDVIGYEVYKNGKLVAFTSTNSFIDTESNYMDNVTYKIIPFDKKLNEGKAVEVSSYKPTIKVQQEELTLKLGEVFDFESIAKAYNYKGEDISGDIRLENTVDTSNKGTYKVTYSVTNEELTTEKIVEVTVVSDYDYLSDFKWESVKTDFGTPRRNTNIKGRVNGSIKTFDKGFGIHANGKIVYDLSDKDYDTFEALLGVDMNIAAQNNSSIAFKIIADGKTLATTNVLKHADDMVYVSVPVKGVEQLVIEVTNGGNGNTSDHAVIANPKLITNNAKPVLTVGHDESIKIRSEYDLKSSIKATDAEDGDLTESIVIDENGFNPNKTGEYIIKYSVTDKDNNVTTAEKKVVVYSEEKYLSDLDWKSATIGSGSVRKDKSVSSNAIRLLNEDNTIETYKKGIGTHSYSEIVYNSEGYDALDTWVGIDQHVADRNSSVIFKVYVDGELRAETDVMSPSTPKEHLVVNVKNSNEVKLVVEEAENGNSWDHADWADIKFLKFNTAPTLNIPESISTVLGMPIDINQEFSASDIEDGDITESVKVEGEVNFDKTGKYPITYTVIDSDGNTVTKTRTIAVVNMDDFTYLSDLDWTKETHTYTKPLKDTNMNGTTISLTDENGNAKEFKKGIGSHSTTTITYDLTGKDYAYFTSYIGVTRNMYNSVAAIGFEVYVDGVLKYSSEVMTGKMPMQFVKVDINDAKELKLVVNDGDGVNWSDHGAWADAKLHSAKENGTSIDRTELNSLIETINKLDSKIYTEDSFNNLTLVLDKVKDNLSDGYNQEEINKLYSELKEAYDALVKLTDFSTLEEAIESNSNLNELHYYKDAITAHKTLVEEAKKVLENENATQEEVDNIVNRLKESAEKLLIRENKVELENKIKEAKEVKNNNYNIARWNNFIWSIDYASEIYNNIEASDEEINSALFTLEYFKDELK